MKKRNNNRGFTLVELIIAVAILAIAVSPLVANFIQSSKMNMKGRKSLNAMNLAQDIMEGLSGYTADEIHATVTEVTTDSSKSLTGNILPITASYTGVTIDSAAAAQKLEYTIYGVETIATEHNKYDVDITLDPTGTKVAQYNGKSVADISEVNQYYDAIFTMPETELDNAISTLKLRATNTTEPVANYYGEIVRTTIVHINNLGDDTNPNYAVSVDRTYAVTSSYASTIGISAADNLVTYTNANISRLDSTKLPRSVYIYFEGMKNASILNMSTGGEERDKFVVKNTTGKDIDVYLLRTQKTDASGNITDTNVIAYNQNYRCVVDIISEDTAGISTDNTYIVSNLRYDLSAKDSSGNLSPKYNFRVKDESNVNWLSDSQIDFPLKEDGTVMVKTDSTMDNRRAEYTYNGAALSTYDEAFYQAHFSDGYQKKNKNKIYEVTIELYEAGTTNKVATYDGGVSN